jgi:hypothetical protein
MEGTAAFDSRVNVIHLPVKLKVRGSGPSRGPSSSEEIEAIPAALSSKSNTSKSFAIRDGFTDLGSRYYPVEYAT